MELETLEVPLAFTTVQSERALIATLAAMILAPSLPTVPCAAESEINEVIDKLDKLAEVGVRIARAILAKVDEPQK